MFGARELISSCQGNRIRVEQQTLQACGKRMVETYLMGFELETEMEMQTPKNWVRGATIGAGAFGSVCLAIDNSNGRLFAVKSIPNSVSSMQNEHDILQSLDSPYIVRCLGNDHTTENGVGLYNLFMEYMPGGSIADLLKMFGGHFDESIIQTYTRSILQGIHYLHSQGIVHCDIKGKNILVGSSGVKIADFGSAKRMSNEEKKLKSNEPLQCKGTPLWMAPEVVKQEEQGPPSDIWSLGCTVVEMASGRPPWSNISHPLVAMYRIACTDEVPEMPQSVSPQCRDFVEKCLQRDPNQRWSSAQLLKHPFLNQGCPTQKGRMPNSPPSPTSTLDFHVGEQEWDSCSSTSSQTVPILSLQRNFPSVKQEGECNTEKNRELGQSPRPSPRDRMLQLAAAGGLENVAERPNWCTSLPGEWIVVRSSNDRSPASDGPFSDIIHGSLTQKSIEKECSNSSEANACGKTLLTNIQEAWAESECPIALTQQVSDCNSVLKPLQIIAGSLAPREEQFATPVAIVLL
eukprot:Gb_38999 [translate_table: standard]